MIRISAVNASSRKIAATMREAGICTETTKQSHVINHHYHSTLWLVNNYQTIMHRPHITTGLSALKSNSTCVKVVLQGLEVDIFIISQTYLTSFSNVAQIFQTV